MPVLIPESINPVTFFNGGCAPYGRKLASNGMLVENSGEQLAIQEATRLRAKGLSLREVAESLFASGITARSGKRFLAQQVRRMLGRGKEKRRTEARRTSSTIARGVQRAIEHGVSYEAVDPFVVFERDSWTCQICHCSTPPDLRGHMTAPNAPTLDHIVPLRAGGPHTYANTRCACHSCNSSGRRSPAT